MNPRDVGEYGAELPRADALGDESWTSELEARLFLRTSAMVRARPIRRRWGMALGLVATYAAGILTTYLFFSGFSGPRPFPGEGEREDRGAGPEGSITEALAGGGQENVASARAGVGANAGANTVAISVADPEADANADARPNAEAALFDPTVPVAEALRTLASMTETNREELLRDAGNARLSTAMDVAGALGCYRELLKDEGDPGRVALDPEDSWLLVYLKRARKLEVTRDARDG